MSYNVLAPNFPFHKSTKWVVAFLKVLKWIAKGSTFILVLNKLNHVIGSYVLQNW